MTDRKKILERIWQNKPKLKTLPCKLAVKEEMKSREELVALFVENLKRAGAQMNNFESRNDAIRYIENNFSSPFYSLKHGMNERYRESTPNEELKKIDTAVIEGQFGVAENGAVWIDDTNFSHRLIPFIATQLILLLDKRKILSDMHEAYGEIALCETSFGVFISGPSKTADIEQNLVYGAHGSIKLFLCLI